ISCGAAAGGVTTPSLLLPPLSPRQPLKPARPASGKYCLGVSLPMRRPRPAAGITTQMAESAFGIGGRLRGRRFACLRAVLWRLDYLIKGFAFFHHAQLGAGALFDS